MGFRGLAIRRRADIDTFSEFNVTRTGLGSSNGSVGVSSVQRLELFDVTIVVTGVMRAAAAALSIIRLQVDVQDTPSFDIIGSWRHLLIGESGSMDSLNEVVVLARSDSGILLPVGEAFRIDVTLAQFAGSAPQDASAVVSAQLRRRVIG